MNSELTHTQLSEYLTFNNGKPPPDRDGEAPIPVFGSKGLIGYAETANAGRNTIVIGRVGRYCGCVYFSEKPCWVSDDAITCSSETPSDGPFWFYCLTFADLNRYRSSSEQRFLTPGTLSAVRCTVPKELETRIRIGQLLASFDTSSPIDREISPTVQHQQMAQAIFKDWFVDLKPVKAKIAAKKRWLALQPEAEPASPVCYADTDVLMPDLETYINLAAMQAISGKDQQQLARLQTEQPEQYATLRATAELVPVHKLSRSEGK